ncbi:MAG: aldose 1-epimerase [Verrucomicrobiales bacterium]|jgi:aldose 1-epimerase
MTSTLQLHSGDGRATVAVDVANGGRVSSLRIDGVEFLVGSGTGSGPLSWGLYPMVPFAGRLRNGHVSFEGREVQLPLTNGPHAIHGYGFTNPWTRLSETEIRYELHHPWPWKGDVIQRFELRESSLTLVIQVNAVDRQPFQLGWHPWFNRTVSTGEEATLKFEAQSMFARDTAGIPSGHLTTPSAGPWDDCFTDIRSGPTLRWGDLVLQLSSTAHQWTIFDKPEHALCIEPQTGPPNALNDDPEVLECGESRQETFTIQWSRHCVEGAQV